MTVIEIMRVNFSFTYVRISNLVFFVSPVRRHKYVGALEAEPRRTMFQPEAAGLSSRADLQKGSPAFTNAGRSRELGGCIHEGIFDYPPFSSLFRDFSARLLNTEHLAGPKLEIFPSMRWWQGAGGVDFPLGQPWGREFLAAGCAA